MRPRWSRRQPIRMPGSAHPMGWTQRQGSSCRRTQPWLSTTTAPLRGRAVPVLLGIDFGTTTLKAVTFDESGNRLTAAAVEPPRDHVTIDGYPVEVWPAEALWNTACELLRRVTAELTSPIDALAIVELG